MTTRSQDETSPPPSWPSSGRSPGPPLLNIWIPVERPGSPTDALPPGAERDVEKSPRTPAHATHSYAAGSAGGPGGAWLHRLKGSSRHGAGGAGVAKRFGAAAVLLVCVVFVLARTTSSVTTVKQWTGVGHVEQAAAAAPVAPTPSPTPVVHKPKPPARPTGSLRPIDIASDALPLDATLDERLAMWESAPGGRGDVEGELEMGEFVELNYEQCENTWPNHNTDFMRRASRTWNTLTRSSIHEHRMELIEAVRTAAAAGELENVGEGRGIVFTAGNADTLTRVLYTMRVLRHVYGSTLPAAVFHFPSERIADPDSPLLAELKELGCAVVEAVGTERDPGKTKSYHLKAIAIIESPWREVLFLDSDNIPTRDPVYMFDAPGYKRLGAMFWPDFWKTGPMNPVWQIMGVKCRDEWEQEAGQIFIDKASHLDALVLWRYMLENHQFSYFLSDGDKDLVRFAFLSLRKRWALPGRYLGAGGLPGRTASGEHCGLTMQQYDHLGQTLFIHYNLLKQVPSGVHRGFTWGKTRQTQLFLDPAHPTNSSSLRGLGDVDADMLADADDNGNARASAAFEVRKRAALERGLRMRWHGGITSALCTELVWDDPRPDSAREADMHAMAASQDPDFHLSQLSDLGIDWQDKQQVLEMALWKDDDLLRDFEAHVYDEGFVPNGKGF